MNAGNLIAEILGLFSIILFFLVLFFPGILKIIFRIITPSEVVDLKGYVSKKEDRSKVGPIFIAPNFISRKVYKKELYILEVVSYKDNGKKYQVCIKSKVLYDLFILGNGFEYLIYKDRFSKYYWKIKKKK